MDGWIYVGRMDGWIINDKWVCGWMIEGLMGGWIDRWTVHRSWVDEMINSRVGGWMY